MKSINILIVLLLILFSHSNIAVAQTDFLIIANKDVSQDIINQNELRKIYFGLTTQWKGQKKIKPTYSEIELEVFLSYIETSKRSYKSFWTKKIFSGNGVAPVEFGDVKNVIDYVGNTSGAIGVIPISLKNEVSADCKIMRIE
ncbi:MAG: hypothetical protein ABJF04_19585 [Reichenbachiella sp.]|uniref:hypothetical protein n=1 Tax=Reichenbachiella sp. TaxID=2184521 RepID=UPI003266845F